MHRTTDAVACVFFSDKSFLDTKCEVAVFGVVEDVYVWGRILVSVDRVERCNTLKFFSPKWDIICNISAYDGMYAALYYRRCKILLVKIA